MPPWAASDAAWQRSGSGLVDVRGAHRLLHAANLPEAELRHMGATRSMLASADDDPARAMWVRVANLAPLLGRIVWDHKYGAAGQRWENRDTDRMMAKVAGQQVIEEFFS